MSYSNLEGREINNELLVIKKKGKGHAGEVYKARLQIDTNYGSKGEEVAVKRYNAWVLEEPDQASRIDAELQASIRINSENVVKSHKLLEWDGNLILVMEYLRGRTLSQFIEQEEEISFVKIIEIINQILVGLDEIHKNKLIHRDIKPDNIMVTDNRVVIMDLGVIKDFNASTSITGSDFLGTIMYAAPEYLFDEEYNQGIDLFSLGMILYELIFTEPLIKTKYWTMNIVEHYFYKFSGPSEYIKHYSEFPERFNNKEKIFLWFILLSLLENKNLRIELKYLLNAVKTKIWENPLNWKIITSQLIRNQKKTLRLLEYYVIKDFEKLIGNIIPAYKIGEEQDIYFISNKGYIKSLFLRKGRLKTLPESIGFLEKLENLDLVGNKINQLPKSFIKLKSLAYLNLVTNYLESLPEEFNQLSNLIELRLDINESNKFPSVITELTSLKKLYLWAFKSSLTLPPSFLNLQNLEELVLMEDIKLPENIGDLKSLRKLVILGPTSIPLSLWNLENLSELVLHVEIIETLPAEINNLKKLKILDLNGNSLLSTIPVEIGELEELNILKFHDTGIKDLPAEILNLRKLKEVHGTTEFVYRSKISRKLQENNVDVYTFKYSAL